MPGSFKATIWTLSTFWHSNQNETQEDYSWRCHLNSKFAEEHCRELRTPWLGRSDSAVPERERPRFHTPLRSPEPVPAPAVIRAAGQLCPGARGANASGANADSPHQNPIFLLRVESSTNGMGRRIKETKVEDRRTSAASSGCTKHRPFSYIASGSSGKTSTPLNSLNFASILDLCFKSKIQH